MSRRSDRLPKPVRNTLDLGSGDKILAEAKLADDSWAVVTRYRLHSLSAEGKTLFAKRWCDVDNAVFDPKSAVITIRWVDEDEPTQLTLANASRARFPQTFRERVVWSVILGEDIRVAGGRSVKVSVRRDENGLFSQVVADPAVRLEDPEVATAVDAAESRLRIASGMGL